MKKLMSVIIFILSTKSFAYGVYDKQTTRCQNKNYDLTIIGKHSLFSERGITLIKKGQLLFSEEYKEMIFPYDEHSAESTVLVPKEFNDIVSYAYTVRPKSVRSEMDFVFRASSHAIIFQTYDPLNPKFGGETEALLIQLKSTNEFIMFELTSDCHIEYDRN